MDGAAARERLLAAWRLELRRSWGRIGEIEAALGHRPGYFSKVFKRRRTVSLDGLLSALDAMDVDPGVFFGRALDLGATPEAFLAEIEAEGPLDPVVTRILRAVSSEAPHAEGAAAVKPALPNDPAAVVERLARRSLGQQRRALRQGMAWRRPELVAALLDHLDEIRDRRPDDVVALCETVAEILPVLAGDEAAQTTLRCRLLAALGSAERHRGAIPAAARAIHDGLVLARRHGLAGATADLLRRTAYILSDRRRFGRALAVLREALEIGHDLDLEADVARTTVDRGVMLHYAGEASRAIHLLRRAWDRLPETGPGIGRNRDAVVHHLILLHSARGEIEEAATWLDRGRARCRDEGTVEHARLLWQDGRLRLRHGRDRDAEGRLRHATEILDRRGRDDDRVLVRLDLWRAVLSRPSEVRRVVRDLTPHLAHLRDRGLPRTVLDDFAHSQRTGWLDREWIRRLASHLQKRQE